MNLRALFSRKPNPPEDPIPGLTEAEIGYVLVTVRANDPDGISALMGQVAEIAIAEGAYVDGMVSGSVLMLFGIHPNTRPENRVSLVRKLVQRVGADIKIVHGATPGHYGTLGGPTCFNWSVIIPEFEEIQRALSDLEYGASLAFPLE